MIVRDLLEKLSKFDPDRRVCFDTDAARFHVHLVEVDNAWDDELGLGDDPVVLTSKAPREYVRDT